jgi:hypothetical protein
MPYSAVSRVELNDDSSITLAIDISGFDEEAYIEISGQAIQDDEAIATFYSVQELQPDENKNATLIVKSISAVPPNDFVKGFPITIIARAAEVWITKLENDTDVTPKLNPGSSDPLKGAWKQTSYGPAVGPPK